MINCIERCRKTKERHNINVSVIKRKREIVDNFQKGRFSAISWFISRLQRIYKAVGAEMIGHLKEKNTHTHTQKVFLFFFFFFSCDLGPTTKKKKIDTGQNILRLLWSRLRVGFLSRGFTPCRLVNL